MTVEKAEAEAYSGGMHLPSALTTLMALKHLRTLGVLAS